MQSDLLSEKECVAALSDQVVAKLHRQIEKRLVKERLKSKDSYDQLRKKYLDLLQKHFEMRCALVGILKQFLDSSETIDLRESIKILQDQNQLCVMDYDKIMSFDIVESRWELERAIIQRLTRGING